MFMFGVFGGNKLQFVFLLLFFSPQREIVLEQGENLKSLLVHVVASLDRVIRVVVRLLSQLASLWLNAPDNPTFTESPRIS